MHAIRGTVGYDPNTDEAARQAAKQASRERFFAGYNAKKDEASTLPSFDNALAFLDEAVADLDDSIDRDEDGRPVFLAEDAQAYGISD